MALSNEHQKSKHSRLTNALLTQKDTLRPSESEPLEDVAGTMRLNRISVGAFFLMHGLTFASWASRIPSIQEKLNLSASALGSVLFALPLGFFISLPLTGWLIGKIGSKKVVIISSILYSLSLVLIGASDQTLSLVVSLFLLGFFANQLNISINTQAVFVERLYKKRLMATFHGLWSVAGFAGAAIGTAMISRQVAPLNHFIFISLVFLIVTAIAAFYLVKKDEITAEKSPLFSMPDRSLVGLGFIAFCSMIAEGAMFDWSGIYFRKVVQVEAELTGLGYTAFMIAMAAMRFLADGLSNRFGLRIILQMSGLLTTIGLLLSVLFPTMIPSLIGFFIIGIGVSSVVPMVYSAAGKSKTLSAGAALTAVSSLGFMGFLIGPPIIGFIAEASSLRISFLAITVMSFSVMVLASAIPKRAGD
jgi:MFS family permease